MINTSFTKIDPFEDLMNISIKGNMNDKRVLDYVKENGLRLRYVDEQTEEICLAAVNEYV